MHVYESFCTPLCKKYQLNQSDLDLILFIANNPMYNTAKDVCEIRGRGTHDSRKYGISAIGWLSPDQSRRRMAKMRAEGCLEVAAFRRTVSGSMRSIVHGLALGAWSGSAGFGNTCSMV